MTRPAGSSPARCASRLLGAVADAGPTHGEAQAPSQRLCRARSGRAPGSASSRRRADAARQARAVRFRAPARVATPLLPTAPAPRRHWPDQRG